MQHFMKSNIVFIINDSFVNYNWVYDVDHPNSETSVHTAA